jgi:hypothetical protein
MARSFARLYVRIWADPDWRGLNADAQHLYALLMSQDSINMAGVLPLQLRKWAGCVADWDVDRVRAALDRLVTDRFTLVDEDTEEVLVRSLIRNDEAYKTPGMLKSILKSAEHTQGPALRRELAVELGRLDPLEGKKADEGTALIAATRMVLLPDGTPPDDGVIHRSDGIGDGIGDTFLGTHRGYLPNSSTEPIGDTSVSVSVSVPSLALVRNPGGEENFPHPPRCARHDELPIGDEPPCRACQRLRENWELANEEALKLARAEAAKPKPMCPEHPGQVDGFCGPCRSEQLAVGR